MKIGRFRRWSAQRIMRKRTLWKYAVELESMAYQYDRHGEIPNNLSGYLMGLAEFLRGIGGRRRKRR